MFDDEKIRLIESMPDADSILVIWIKLLAQAGKTNATGYIYLNENIPYTDEMLATLFCRPLSTIRLALNTFKNFGMIEIDDGDFISITNWEKHQNIQGLEKIREDTRKRVQKYRENKRLGNGNCNVTVTESNATEEELEEEKEKIPYKEIVEYLNEKSNSSYKHNGQATRTAISARWNEGHRLEDFKLVIEYCSREWTGKTFSNGKKGETYLRPSTLFNTKFDEKLNEAKKNINKTQPQYKVLTADNMFGADDD